MISTDKGEKASVFRKTEIQACLSPNLRFTPSEKYVRFDSVMMRRASSNASINVANFGLSVQTVSPTYVRVFLSVGLLMESMTIRLRTPVGISCADSMCCVETVYKTNKTKVKAEYIFLVSLLSYKDSVTVTSPLPPSSSSISSREETPSTLPRRVKLHELLS